MRSTTLVVKTFVALLSVVAATPLLSTQITLTSSTATGSYETIQDAGELSYLDPTLLEGTERLAMYLLVSSLPANPTTLIHSVLHTPLSGGFGPFRIPFQPCKATARTDDVSSDRSDLIARNARKLIHQYPTGTLASVFPNGSDHQGE